jgi:ubiquitin-conjugating enzyme E2 J1
LGEGAGKAEEVVVPEELKMGWRDEMEAKGKKAREESGGGTEDGESESDALAEGFVQTAPVLPASSSSSSGSAQQQQQQQQQTVPQPTRTVPSPSPLPVAAGPPLQQIQRRAADEGTVWLDRLIVAVAVLLAAVIAKVMFA